MSGNVRVRTTSPAILALAAASLFLLQACGDEDNSPATPTQDVIAPTIPAQLTATTQSATTIQLTWDASSDGGTGVQGYRVYRNGVESPIATVATPGYMDVGLAPSTSYVYWVTAFDDADPPNVSAASASSSATTMAAPVADTTPPTVPGNLTATAASASSIQLSWQASTDSGSGIAGYRVYRNGGAAPVATVTTTTYLDGGLASSAAYSYTVVAFDAASPANVSDASAVASATTLAVTVTDTTPPSVPAGVAATAQSVSTIQLNWQASTDSGTGVAGYRIYRNGGATPIATVTSTSYLDAGLAASTTYSYTVTAFDAAAPANVSAASTAATATTSAVPDTTPPTVPTGLTATAQSVSSIQLTWQASTDSGSGVAGYRVYRSGGSAPIATVTTNSYVDTGLMASTTYSYTVAAFDAASPTNVSVASAAASATTLTPADTTAPTVPGGLTATAQSTSSIRLDWQASVDGGSGVAGYRIYRDSGTTPIATVTTPGYLDSGLAASTTYSYTVTAYDLATPANVSAASSAATATTSADTTGISGLDARPSNPDCLAGDAPAGTVSLATERAFPNLMFNYPVGMLQEPASNARWYVLEQLGVVRVFDNTPAVATTRVFIDVTATIGSASLGEMGLLGMAFHPNWPTDPRAYLSYTVQSGGQIMSRIVEYRTLDGGSTLAASTAKIILQINQPEGNHKGGNIMFGPDGYLYAGFGDGGGGADQHDPIGNGQRLSTLLGKMLRIDVNGTTGATPYAIPESNPFKYASGSTANAVCNNDTGAWTQNCPEIYAYGFRNPWRWSFDSATGALWVGDVGEAAWEEVDKVVAGGNYGWRCFEGNHAFNANCGTNAASAIKPIAEYSHSLGSAITGGFVYRGSAIPSLNGRYVFSDSGSGSLWSIPIDTAPTTGIADAGLSTGLAVVDFAQDHAGELYMVDYATFRLAHLVAGSASGRTIPAQLSATGCVNPADATQPASGLIAYAPNAAFWSDGAVKSRWLALPDGQHITVNTDGDFDFPTGSVLMKNFRVNSRLIETRLFMRHNDGNWAGYTYEWNAAGTDATRVVGGKTVQVDGQDWHFPSESQCLLCHTQAAGRSLGLEISQLNGNFGYALTGRTANQLTTLDTLAMLSPQLTQPVAQLPAMPDPYGSTGSLNDRARAYLHVNCSQCHRPGGPTDVDMDFRYTTPLASTHACDVVPGNALGVANARRIAIGSNAAARSMVVVRAGLTDSNSMPPLQPRVVDTAGIQLLTQWINSLASCN